MTTTILIADDDPALREVLRIAMEQAGHRTLCAGDGRAALQMAARHRPDLMILDIGLPELDGFEVCRRLRRQDDLPVVFLSARDGEIDRVVGMELGADDYVTKPFSPRELVARVRAILKRVRGDGPAARRRHGALTLDPAAHVCLVAARPLNLTATEFALLARLMQRPGHVVTRRQLVDALYGPNSTISDRTVDSHLRNLRAKLAEAGCPDAIETLHGFGLRLGPCAAT
jgi:two-component system OmpR family response regulator